MLTLAIFLTLVFLVLLLGGGCVLLQLIGLPGTWLLLLLAVAVWGSSFVITSGPEPIFSIWTLVVLLAFAVLAEVVEFFASAAGAKTGGASRRGMAGAVVGGLGGAIVGTIFFVPVIGSILGAVGGSALGAIVGELSEGGRTLRSTAKPAAGAVAGRVAGTLAKSGFAGAMWLWMMIALFV